MPQILAPQGLGGSTCTFGVWGERFRGQIFVQWYWAWLPMELCCQVCRQGSCLYASSTRLRVVECIAGMPEFPILVHEIEEDGALSIHCVWRMEGFLCVGEQSQLPR